MSKILIKVENMSIGHGKKNLFNNICLEIYKGDCIMLCGANGSGKTTFLKALRDKAGDIATMIPTRIPKIEGFTLAEFIRISCYRHSDMGGRLSETQEAALLEAMESLGIKSLADRDISTLSDGEFQKAGIAAAIAMDASLILLDEPTAFLDAENRMSILSILRELCIREGKAVVFSTHDLHDGREAATKIFALGADKVFRQGDEDEFEILIKSIFSSGETSPIKKFQKKQS